MNAAASSRDSGTCFASPVDAATLPAGRSGWLRGASPCIRAPEAPWAAFKTRGGRGGFVSRRSPSKLACLKPSEPGYADQCGGQPSLLTRDFVGRFPWGGGPTADAAWAFSTL